MLGLLVNPHHVHVDESLVAARFVAVCRLHYDWVTVAPHIASESGR